MVTDPSRLAPMLEDAIRLANSGRRGPVVLHVPRDLFAAEVQAIDPAPVNIARPGPAAPEDIDAIAAMLAGAERPVIFAGGGFKWGQGREALTALAEALEVPVVASTGHADVMRHGHPWFAGQAGPRGNRVASRLTKEADVMVVLGARLGFNSTFPFERLRGRGHTHRSCGCRRVCRGAVLPRRDRRAGRCPPDRRGAWSAAPKPACDAWRDAFRADMESLAAERAEEAAIDTLPMPPRRALAEIREVLPEDAIVTLDTGNTCLQAADPAGPLRADEPDHPAGLRSGRISAWPLPSAPRPPRRSVRLWPSWATAPWATR